MTLDFEITEENLLKALADLKACKERGFTHCTSVFHISSVSNDGSGRNANASYSEKFILKADLNNPHLNWGSCTLDSIQDLRYSNGKIINVDEER